ncbi:MAG: LPXTG cell wall anchor domain-containing protein [Oscillospiraceae bacterium]|nr:LPXTG cell wall anchor domain-containing protein [Oscillospiraceae bacterium]
MKKRLLALGLCLVLALVFLPTALADPVHTGMDDNAYLDLLIDGRLDDAGIVEARIVASGGAYIIQVWDKSVSAYVKLPDYVGSLVADGAVVAPGYESAVTFRIINAVPGYAGVNVTMRTQQIGIPEVNPPYTIPRDKNQFAAAGLTSPIDSWGNSPPVEPYPVSYKTYLPELYDWYPEYPPNVLDKIQYAAYAYVTTGTSNAYGPFRYDATKVVGGTTHTYNAAPKAPGGLGAYYRSSGWMTTWMRGAAYQVPSISIPYGGTLFVHYIFSWDGHIAEQGSTMSVVAPSNSILSMFTEPRNATDPFVERRDNGDGTVDYLIPDNYYQLSRGAFEWIAGITPFGPPVSPPPESPSGPPESDTPPSGDESPTETIPESEPPLASPYTDPPPDSPIIGSETPPEIESLPPDSEPPIGPLPTPSPNMPITGGTNLANLFFVGLFLFGIGLIFLKSRKKDDKEKHQTS